MKKLSQITGLFFILCALALSAPSKDYWGKWAVFNPTSNKQIDFSPWQQFLDKYLIIKNGQSYVNYHKVTAKDKALLKQFSNTLSQMRIEDYNRNEQMAYWINLYNLLTVEEILTHPTVKSITDIDTNWLGQSKVWDKTIIIIDNTKITLNDIEHRVLRPIWNDPRIHAAVNCASISCPNLATFAFEGDKINHQLNEVFSAFVNSTKGVELKGNSIYLSKIFDWYGSDFGDEKQMRQFIAFFVKSATLKAKLLNTNNSLSYQSYNWNLNQLD